MANNNDLTRLRQGVKRWNQWRSIHPEERVNLKGANLMGCDLRTANLENADLSFANLQAADLTDADLTGATLRGIRLKDTRIEGAWLSHVNLHSALMERTVLYDLDLSQVEGLETVRHSGPSSIGIDTLSRSKGEIPRSFLRGCGLADWEIAMAKLYAPDLTDAEINDIIYEVSELRGSQPIVISSLFISYSHSDSEFIDTLEPHFDEKGVRYWRDVHDMKAGRMDKQVDLAIRYNPTVLLVLSRNSVNSDWVEWEVSRARALEKQLGRDVLCPVALDLSWKTCNWPGPLRTQIEKYYILDFSLWKNDRWFVEQFAKLLEGLAIFYRGVA